VFQALYEYEHLANPQGFIESLNFFQKTPHLQLSSTSKSLRLAQPLDTPSNSEALTHELHSISRIGQM
jgi:hypothetical protein